MKYKCLSDGHVLELSVKTLIRRGGEGSIHRIPGAPSLIAKIYHRPTPERADKLRAMMDNPPEIPGSTDGHAFIAWPQDLLVSAGGSPRIVGYIMPYVQNASPLMEFYLPATRRRQSPLFSYQYLVRTARNIAVTVHALHAHGYVAGDINESNFMVAETALVTMVDTDSFQVPDSQTKTIHRCPVGKPEFTPPEIQGKRFADFDRIPEHDRFGLGVLVFKLLMEGVHPFDGLYRKAGEPPPLEKRIACGYFPYSRHWHGPFQPKPSAPQWETLDPSLRHLFLQCFEAGFTEPKRRPDALTWIKTLTEVEMRLVACKDNSQHQYGKILKTCPWCKRKKMLAGRDPFPSKEAVQRGEHLRRPLQAPTTPSLVRRTQKAVATALSRVWTRREFPLGKIMFIVIELALLLVLLKMVFPPSPLNPIFIPPSPSARPHAATSPPPYQEPPEIPEGLQIRGNAGFTLQLMHAVNLSEISMGALAFSQDSRYLAVGGKMTRAIYLLDVQKGEWRNALRDINSTIQAMAFSPDGSSLAGGSSDNQITIWDLNRMESTESFYAEGRGGISIISFAPTLGRLLAFGTSNGVLGVRNLDTRKGFTRNSSALRIRYIAFTPDGNSLISGGDNQIKVWNAANGELLRAMGSEREKVFHFTLDSQKNHLTYVYRRDGQENKEYRKKTIHFLTGKMISDIPIGNLKIMAISPGQNYCAISGKPGAIVEILDMRSSLAMAAIDNSVGAVSYLSQFSPDGRKIAVVNGTGLRLQIYLFRISPKNK